MAWDLADVFPLYWIMMLLFSCVVPLRIFVGRNNIRVSRREIVQDLKRLFSFAKADGKPLILPSFELVKYKYDPDSNRERTKGSEHAKGHPESGSFYYYMFPVLMYVMLSAVCFYVAFVPYKDPNTGAELIAFLHPSGNLRGALTYWCTPDGWYTRDRPLKAEKADVLTGLIRLISSTSRSPAPPPRPAEMARVELRCGRSEEGGRRWPKSVPAQMPSKATSLMSHSLGPWRSLCRAAAFALQRIV
jgi:hypothetical protein